MVDQSNNVEPLPSTGRILLALSGGTDSTAAAILLIRQGYQVEAVYMITGQRSISGLEHVGFVADLLGIKLHILDLRADFERIAQYMVCQYSLGRTPNPCVLCNQTIKFKRLWDFAQACGAQRLATGHYARLLYTDQGPGLFEAADRHKDQSYVLAMVDRSMLSRILFPLGTLSKTQARAITGSMGIEGFTESQEVCFIPDDDYVRFIESRCPDLARPGFIVDPAGKVLGRHHGIHRFTIGQRRGLGVAMGEPYYVLRLDPGTNTVVLGPVSELRSQGLVARDCNWLIDPPAGPIQAWIKIRYNDRGRPGTIIPQGQQVVVRFYDGAMAATPGQLAVFYGTSVPRQVLGGAWIDRTW